ncbi:helix-turn-helix transcriptional regulator [Halorientalis salina]|uniref:helix-turn-helix transcriptional regulator n=1 Tax=Halorientalis salina TaxID=2932266 RepID=UPI0010ACF558|nr:helix-turn-helix domain-containing protein [Halorientalis salina]
MPKLTLERLNKLVSTLLSVDSTSATSAGEETVVEQSEQPPVKGMEESLQTDEEQILQLLAEHDHRLWQGDVVAKTGFSESKTSRLLCKMENNGKISRGQVGRQKVVDLPDSDE